MAFAGTNISLSQPDITQKLTERIDDLNQKIAAWGKRIRRFSEKSRRLNQNRLFQSDQKRLYKSLERPEVCGAGPGPDQADTVAFWRGLWSEPVNHSDGPWMEVVASQSASVTPMDPVTITPEDVAEAVRRAPNWKSPVARRPASLLAEGVRSVSRCARPTVSRGSRSEVAPEPLHY
ncbi:unnamed protein product [Parnassius apollo]|uniref:(apollo) hypothetical protein n=1 Tax=Parnassius apollo TaxID=110799 RepID=A0A8S3X5G5_PARAO|nr:unnamed protein product [Parnassius apollo]